MTFQALTIEQYRDRIGERQLHALADRDGDGALDDEEQKAVDLALQRGTSLAYSLIGINYATPLDETEFTEQLRGAVGDFATWYLSLVGDVTSELKRTLYKDAKEWCMAVGNRKAQLGGDSAAQPAVRREIAVHDGDPRVFLDEPVGAIL